MMPVACFLAVFSHQVARFAASLAQHTDARQSGKQTILQTDINPAAPTPCHLHFMTKNMVIHALVSTMKLKHDIQTRYQTHMDASCFIPTNTAVPQPDLAGRPHLSKCMHLALCSLRP